jgi:CubicO group peptidase (beta-lactamase class C family)
MPTLRDFRRARIPGLLLLLCAVGLAQTAPPADLDAWVARAMKEFEVPGLAVAIVKDGRTVLAKGYGVRKLGEPVPVDEHTLFGIASNSKAFTAAALAILADEGKLSWDDPVQKHLPSFQLYDPFVTRELTVRDLLCHRSGLGLGAGDLLFWPDTDVTRDQVVAAVRWIRPASSLRSRYAYNNLMFVVAGQVVAAVSGKPWDDFVRERIFTPLGMMETRISVNGNGPADNFAAPHSRGWRLEGTLTPIRPTQDRTWAAAAGIRSNVIDLSKWVAAHLNGGKVNGKALWSEAAAREMWSAQTVIRISEPKEEALKAIKPNFAAYGLGWSLKDYHGKKVVSHGGALTGMVSTVVMMPSEQLGVIVLTNQEESGAFSAIVNHVLDHYLKLPPTDWIAAYDASRKRTHAEAAETEAKQVKARAADSKPSLALSDYVGEYRDPWYGKAVIAQEGGKLVLRMSHTPAMVGDLEHWQHDTFIARWRDKTIPDAFVTFALNGKGKVGQVTMTAISPIADFSFDYDDLLFTPVSAAPAL